MANIFSSIHNIVKIEMKKVAESTIAGKSSYSSHITFYLKDYNDKQEKEVLDITLFSDNAESLNILTI